MVLRLLLHFLFIFQWAQVGAVLSNRTIDDTLGDSVTGGKPVYLPAGTWDGPSCSPSHCRIIPSPDLAFDNTYSAATYIPGQGARTAQFSFKGTDIYVFFILANNVPNAWTETFCRFILDGQGTDYHYAPSQSTAYDYNALVYSQHNLPNIDHTLLITADGYSTLSFLNFDYAIYTVDDGTSPAPAPASPAPASSPPPSSPNPTSTVTLQPPGVTSAPGTLTTLIGGKTVVSVGQSQTSSPLVGSASKPTIITSQAQTSPTVVSSGASTHRSLTGVLVGGIVGGIVVLLLILVLLFLLRRQRRLATGSLTTATPENPILEPFTATHPTPQPSPETRAVPHDHTSVFISERKRRPQVYSPTTSTSTSSEILRAQRQAELSNKISELTREMHGLSMTGSTTSASTSRWEGSEVSRVMEQNIAMKAQIEQLQGQLHSEWALGLSNDPPPEYSRP